jgi:hypothetical protein
LYPPCVYEFLTRIKFNWKYLWTSMIYVYTKCNMSDFGSLVFRAIRQKAICEFRPTTVSCFTFFKKISDKFLFRTSIYTEYLKAQV